MDKTGVNEAFVGDLRRALRGLYDPTTLRHSPLIALFGLEGERDPLAALRRVLLQGIESLKPGPDVPLQANAWRVYQILYERYVEQFGQEDVAAHLAVGARQVRRQEGRGLRVLAERLWQDQRLDLRPAPARPSSRQPAAVVQMAPPSREQELALLESYPADTLAAGELVQGVLRLLTPLCRALDVTLVLDLPHHLPHAMSQPILVRQALSNLLTTAVQISPGGQVSVSVQVKQQALDVCIETRPGQEALALSGDELDNLAVAQRLATLAGGTLELSTSDRAPFQARLTLPVPAEVRVLAIDDNADTLRLVEHYLAGTRYRFQGVTSPQEGFQLAIQRVPDAILLDVMLPGLDGWEVLGRLRQHPQTGDVPVIVCTILAQERLALSLGAAAFLRKPISREALLAALDQQVQWQATAFQPAP